MPVPDGHDEVSCLRKKVIQSLPLPSFPSQMRNVVVAVVAAVDAAAVGLVDVLRPAVSCWQLSLLLLLLLSQKDPPRFASLSSSSPLGPSIKCSGRRGGSRTQQVRLLGYYVPPSTSCWMSTPRSL